MDVRPYYELPIPLDDWETNYKVLKIEYKDSFITVCTANFAIRLPSHWSKDADLEATAKYWDKMDYKFLRSYWIAENLVRWELWSDYGILGWFNVEEYEY